MGAYLLPARRHQAAFHALIMQLNRRLAGRRLDDFDQTISTIDERGGLWILRTSWPEALCGARSSLNEAGGAELLDLFFYRPAFRMFRRDFVSVALVRLREFCIAVGARKLTVTGEVPDQLEISGSVSGGNPLAVRCHVEHRHAVFCV
jgi:hypothetical protein